MLDEASPTLLNLPMEIEGLVKKEYSRFPPKPLEWKIQEYIRLLDTGWSRNYARSLCGLKRGNLDFGKAMQDKRVKEAHQRSRNRVLEKQKGKFGR